MYNIKLASYFWIYVQQKSLRYISAYIEGPNTLSWQFITNLSSDKLVANLYEFVQCVHFCMICLWVDLKKKKKKSNVFVQIHTKSSPK